MDYLQLGASLYVPGNRHDLIEIGNLVKFPFLRSVIFCTEDAIYERDVDRALRNLEEALQYFEDVPLRRFVRVRTPALLQTLLHMNGIHKTAGFVIPKITQHNIEEYFSLIQAHDPFQFMLTLESREVFDPSEMSALRDLLLEERIRRRILSLRIGGNDLLNILGMRRPKNCTLYSTPLGAVIANLVSIFRPCGFNLTAPVYDYLENDKLLRREVRRDLAHGLFGKTAIHPRQVRLIENRYRVSREEFTMAESILSGSAPAVFRCHNAMCEPATHAAWAEIIRERARIYGVRKSIRRLPNSHRALEPQPNGNHRTGQ